MVHYPLEGFFVQGAFRQGTADQRTQKVGLGLGGGGFVAYSDDGGASWSEPIRIEEKDLSSVEEKIGKPLSPYAVTKLVNELYAEVFARTYDFKTIGLRYFNIFGPHQDPNGAYAAVIPKWTSSAASGNSIGSSRRR